MSRIKLGLIIQLFVLSTATASILSEEDLKNKFTLKVPEGDCIEGQLPGDFSKFKNINQHECASYCVLNSDCNGYSYGNIQVATSTGDCNLKSINDCATRVTTEQGAFKFYSKNL